MNMNVNVNININTNMNSNVNINVNININISTDISTDNKMENTDMTVSNFINKIPSYEFPMSSIYKLMKYSNKRSVTYYKLVDEK